MQTSDAKTITQMYINEYGEYKTRIWHPTKVKGALRQVMKEVDTDKTQIRTLNPIYKPHKQP